MIQIGDDIDGLWPKNNLRSDLSCNKWTLPVAYAMEVTTSSSQEQLRRYLEAAAMDSAAEAEARQIIIQSGALVYLATMAKWHYAQAESSLRQAARPGSARDELLDLLERAVPRRGQ